MQPGQDHEGGDDHRRVTDDLGDERLARSQHRAGPFVPVADEQVAGQGHHGPPDEQDQQVRGQHQQQHREDEQVHVAEEPPVPGILVHVADGVDVDEETHPGDHHDHERAQRVESDVDADVEIPLAEVDPVPQRERRRLVDVGSAGDLGQHDDPGDEGDQDDAGPDPVDEAPSQTHTCSTVDHAAQQRHSDATTADEARRLQPALHHFAPPRNDTEHPRRDHLR